MRVETVNGAHAEPPEERPWFGELTAGLPDPEAAGAEALKDVPYGAGSRVAIAGPPGAGATTLLREIAHGLSGDEELGVQVVLAGARPEEVDRVAPRRGPRSSAAASTARPRLRPRRPSWPSSAPSARSSAAATPWW